MTNQSFKLDYSNDAREIDMTARQHREAEYRKATNIFVAVVGGLGIAAFITTIGIPYGVDMILYIGGVHGGV